MSIEVVTLPQPHITLEAAMAKFVKVKTVAERYNVSTRTVLRWIDAGFFPNAMKINPLASNSHYRIPETDLEAFEEKQKASTKKS